MRRNKTNNRRKIHVSNLNETIIRSWCTFRSPNSPLEPKNEKYIFTERNGIYIIDLQKTVKKLEEAYEFMRQVGANGGKVLFVGTKNKHKTLLKKKLNVLATTTSTNAG